MTDFLLIKTDSKGNEIWSKTFGPDFRWGGAFQQTTDGGYILCGGVGNIYLIKTDSNGEELWRNTFGGSGWELGQSVQQTTDGGYIVTGRTSSFGAGDFDVYVVKTDSDGNEVWSKTFGGINDDYPWDHDAIQQTDDGGYIICGYTDSSGAGGSDVYLVYYKPESECNLDSRFEETNITNGIPYYTDRSYKLTSVPNYYKNLPMIKTPNNDRANNDPTGYLTFQAEADTSVYVAFDQRATDLPDWMDDFIPTGDFLGTSLLSQRYLRLFTKFYLEGECIDLGGNYGLGSSDEYRSNYIVIIEPFDLCALDPRFNEAKVANAMRYYTDRDYRITGDIPNWMLGRTLIQTPNDEKTDTSASGYLSFTTPVSWWVYILFDSRSASVPNWLNGWERYTKYPNIKTSLATQPSLKMFRKMFDAGECVNLGGNYGPGSSGEYRSNYAVVYGK